MTSLIITLLHREEDLLDLAPSLQENSRLGELPHIHCSNKYMQLFSCHGDNSLSFDLNLMYVHVHD